MKQETPVLMRSPDKPPHVEHRFNQLPFLDTGVSAADDKLQDTPAQGT